MNTNENNNDDTTMSGINIDGAKDVNLSAGGDIVAGNKTVVQNIINQIADKVVSAPYKFLASYSISDHEIFFGRDRVTEELAGKISRHKCVIINGRSGSGKSSLINAGLIPRLAEMDYYYISFRDYLDPLRQVKELIARESEFSSDEVEKYSLLELLQEVSQRKTSKLVIILDQFERFFVSTDIAMREAFIAELKPCLESNVGSDVINFVISLRVDFFGLLVSEFEKTIPAFLNECSHFNLFPLNRDEAREAIVRPLKHVPNMGYDLSFVDTVLIPDLITESAEREQIEPSHLQIVCDQLYQHVGAEMSEEIELGGAIVIGNELYETLGKTRGILKNYLDDFIARIAQQHENTGKVLRSILKTMVETIGTRKFVTKKDIYQRLPDVDENTVDLYIKELQNGRVVEAREREGGIYYSVSHEVMVEKVHTWFDEREMKQLRAKETLERGMAEWKNSGSPLNEIQVGKIRKWLSGNLNKDEIDLLDQSQKIHDEQRKAVELQQRRMTLAKRSTIVAIIVGMVVSTSFAYGLQLALEEAQEMGEELQTRILKMAGEAAVEGVALGAQPGNIKIIDENAELIAYQWWKPEKNVVVARKYEKGRVLATGHDDFVIGSEKFVQPAIEWLIGLNSPNYNIRISSGHNETIKTSAHKKTVSEYVNGNKDNKNDYTVDFIPGKLTEKSLADTGVLIIGSANDDLDPDEIEAVKRFVQNGGGLFLAGLGWSWIRYGHSSASIESCPKKYNKDDRQCELSEYPMNKLGKKFGITWGPEALYQRGAENT
ncbi:MAG: hypothetical protein COB04_17460 [Gammaproteobacteria bacterium]|nr:MAG: hypothetical protein COB04_17460 [Gammaproteobacteria bacterium]